MGEIKAIVLHCKDFKERMMLTKKYLKYYNIENLNTFLLLTPRRGNKGNGVHKGNW